MKYKINFSYFTQILQNENSHLTKGRYYKGALRDANRN